MSDKTQYCPECVRLASESAASSAREARLREALEDLLRWDETGVRAFEVEDYAEAIQNACAALADPPRPVEGPRTVLVDGRGDEVKP